jgi:DNA mismatch endonuclease, patch repair protein
MTDRLSSAQRSALMARVKSRDTTPEKFVRSLIYRQGFRYRVCVRTLPGAPDIVFPRKRKVIFVHGCFWHQHKNCPRSRRPKTARSFWNKKLNRNILRDRVALRELRRSGWRCLVLWECEIKKSAKKTEAKILQFLAVDAKRR